MYEDKTYEALLDDAEADVDDTEVQTEEGSLVYNSLSALSLELSKIYIQLDYILKQMDVDEADSVFLNYIAKDRGIARKTATAAEVSITCNVAVPIGARFSLRDFIYDVTELIDDSTHTYKAVCETTGSGPNTITGDLTAVDHVDGLENATLTKVLITGSNEETDDALRTRYHDSFDALAFAGNLQDYREKILSVSGVGACKLKRAWNKDINPQSFYPSDKVKAWYEALTGLDSDVKAWIDAIYTAASQRLLTVGGTVLVTIVNSDYGAASSTLVQNVKNYIDPTDGNGDGFAPIGHLVTVQAATAVTINVAATLTFDTGYTYDSVKDQISTVLSDYLLSLCKDWASQKQTIVRIKQIEAKLLAIDGIVDLNGLKLNDGESNITLTEYEIPVYGGFTNG